MELTQLQVYFKKYGKQNVIDFYSAYQSNLYKSTDELWREFALKRFNVVTKGTKYVNLRKQDYLSRYESTYDEDLQLLGRIETHHRPMVDLILRNGNNQSVLKFMIDIKEIEKEIEENVN